MQVMLQYTFQGGFGSRTAYERFAHWQPSDGFEIKGGWTAATNAGGFLLLEAANEAALLEFCTQFRDLNSDLTLTPVVELFDSIPVVEKAYKWIDSVS